MRVYFAGPLFSNAEQDFNKRAAAQFEAAGHEVFLPQEKSAALVGEGDDWPKKVFLCDRDGVEWAEVVVAVMDGAQVDDGTAWECGYAYAAGKPIIGLRTDFRKCGDGDGAVNLMLAESAEAICGSVAEALDALEQAKKRVA